MPVLVVKGREGPGDPLQGQAAANHRVVRDVEIVIEVDELMTDHLPINRESGNGQGSRHQELFPAKAPRTMLFYHFTEFPSHTTQVIRRSDRWNTEFPGKSRRRRECP